MKKLLVLLLAAALLCGCNVNDVDSGDNTTTTTATAPTSSDQTEDTTTATTTVTTTTTTTTIIEDIPSIFPEAADKDWFWAETALDEDGTVISSERYCEDWAFYEETRELIEKAESYERRTTSGSSAYFCYLNETVEIDGKKYVKIKSEEFFDCKNLSELYEYYLTIYADGKNYEDFCKKHTPFLAEYNGELYYWDEFAGGSPLYVYSSGKLVIYDKTEDSAKVMIRPREDVKYESGEFGVEYNYTFYAELALAADGWHFKRVEL